MDFVTIGHAGNPADTSAEANPYGCGSVGYNYRIGKYEVTNAQWSAFTAAAGVPTGNDGGYGNSAAYTDAQQPTNNVSWYEAAQFCNYLTSGDKSKGAYQFSGNNTNPGSFLGINRNAAISAYGTAYFIPTEDEWYKAAYYKPDGSGYSLYANGTNIAPIADVQSNYANGNYFIPPWNVGTGTQEQNGTFDMMGNVWEWNETICGYGGYEDTPYYGIRGGCFLPYSNGDGLKSSDRGWVSQDTEYYLLGFRVASEVPEPATLLLLGLGAAIVRRKRK
jgi:formylglycine-generating enzyme required for sulfatase activity